MDAKARALLVIGTMRVRNSNVLHLSRLWHPDALAARIPADHLKSCAAHPNGLRFFSGNFHLNVAESEDRTFEIGYVKTTNDLITQCAHDIYSILLESLVWQTGVHVGELIMTQEMYRIS
jgi:hypothetical protein